MKQPPKFKQASFYQIELPTRLPDWQTVLAPWAFQPCQKTEWMRMGMIPFYPASSFYVFAQPPCYFFRIQEEKRLLPSAVIKQTLDERVAQLEQKEHRPISRREKQDLKDAITLELLPKSFTRRQTHIIQLDTASNLLVVHRTSPKTVDQLLSFWREIFPDQKITALETERSLRVLMGEWLKHGPSISDFVLDERCQIQHPKTQAQIRGDRQDLTDPEWANWLLEGYQVKNMGLIYADRFRFVLQEPFQIKQMVWPEEVNETGSPDADDELGLWDSTLRLQSAELQAVVNDLLHALNESPSEPLAADQPSDQALAEHDVLVA